MSDRQFLQADPDKPTYSDRVLERDGLPWTLEEIVRAQCLDCEGKPIEEIAHELSREISDVARVLYADPEPRQERAGVSRADLKGFV